MNRVWWVNQSNRKGAAENETVWAPEANSAGWTPTHWATMRDVTNGDLIYHYTNGALVGVSRALSAAVESPNPYPENPMEWGASGYRIPVDFSPFDAPVPRDEIPEQVRLTNVGKHGPFDKRGWVQQGYLFPVSADLFAAIADLTGADFALAELPQPEQERFAGPTDSMTQTIVRREQPVLRRRLLGGRTVAPCGICGTPTPSDFLVAGHIKQRSLCSERERKSPHVAMLVCVIGCDRAFEIGDITVDAAGRVSVSERLRNTRPDLADRVDGVTAPAFNAQSAKFFAARRDALSSPSA